MRKQLIGFTSDLGERMPFQTHTLDCRLSADETGACRKTKAPPVDLNTHPRINIQIDQTGSRMPAFNEHATFFCCDRIRVERHDRVRPEQVASLAAHQQPRKVVGQFAKRPVAKRLGAWQGLLFAWNIE